MPILDALRRLVAADVRLPLYLLVRIWRAMKKSPAETIGHRAVSVRSVQTSMAYLGASHQSLKSRVEWTIN